VTICDVTGNVKGHRKASQNRTHDQEADKIDPVKILGIEKQVGYAKVFPKTACYHGKQDHPAQNKHMITLKIVQEKLNRQGIKNLRNQEIQSSHKLVFQVMKFWARITGLGGRPRR
jgi:hypothetical protein